MTRNNLNLVAVGLALALVAIVAGFVAREPIERELFLRQARSVLGPDVDVSWADYGANSWEVAGLTVGSNASSIRLQAAYATLARAAGATHVELERPVLTVAAGLDPLSAATELGVGLDRFEKTYPNTDVRLRGGRIVFASGTELRAIAGVLRAKAQPPSSGAPGWLPGFDGSMNLAFAGVEYPLTLRSNGSGGSATLASFDADALPVAAFASIERSDAPVRPVSGTVSVHWDASRGTARLDDVTLALGPHLLHGLHGQLLLESGALGSRNVVGNLDAVPFDAAGEIHDVPRTFRWLYDGTRELRAYADLLDRIADEPQLRSVHVDTTAPGLGFAQYALRTAHGPLAISLLTIDPSEPTLRFDTAIAGDHVISGGERTSAMGVRTSAVAGVNGDYFDIGRTYQPQGMLVRDGELVRGPVDRAALAIDAAKRVRFDEFHITGSLRARGQRFPITQLNDWPAGAVTVITPAFGTSMPPAAGVTFAALEPAGSPNRYRVTGVSPASEPLPVTFGVALGPQIRASLHPGEIVQLFYRLEPDVSDAVAAIGGGPILVRDGAWYEDPHAPAPAERDVRWPVVALARQTGDRLLLVAADGRHPERSIGMTRPEFAALLIRLGATDAMALDSGGSVTLVSRAPGDATVKVRNVPSDHSAERWISDALFIYSSAAPPDLLGPAATVTPVPEKRPAP